jgi:hypothetical protein
LKPIKERNPSPRSLIAGQIGKKFTGVMAEPIIKAKRIKEPYLYNP